MLPLQKTHRKFLPDTVCRTRYMHNTKFPLPVLYLAIFLDLLAVSMIVPLVATMNKRVPMDPITFGVIGSAYGFAQFFSGPLLGHLSDLHGRKSILMLSFVGSALGYLLLGFAESVALLFLSRIIVGTVKQTMSLSQAVVTDVTTQNERVTAFGRISTAASMGFVVGPAIGGMLQSRLGPSFPAVASATLLIIDFCLVWIIVPNPPKKATPTVTLFSIFSDQFTAVKKILAQKVAGGMLFHRFIRALCNSMIISNFGLMMSDFYGLPSEYLGYVLSYSGLLGVISSFVVGYLTHYFTKNSLVIFSTIFTIFFDVASTTILTNFRSYLAMMPFQSLFESVITTITLAVYSAGIPADQSGLGIGVSGCSDSIARILAPFISGLLYHYFNVFGIRGMSAILTFVSLFIWKNTYVDSQNIEQIKDPKKL